MKSPILNEIHTKVKHMNNLARETRWKSKDVDWEAFNESVEKDINSEDPSNLSFTERITRFNSILKEV